MTTTNPSKPRQWVGGLVSERVSWYLVIHTYTPGQCQPLGHLTPVVHCQASSHTLVSIASGNTYAIPKPTRTLSISIYVIVSCYRQRMKEWWSFKCYDIQYNTCFWLVSWLVIHHTLFIRDTIKWRCFVYEMSCGLWSDVASYNQHDLLNVETTDVYNQHTTDIHTELI